MVRLLTSTRDPATIFEGLSPRVWLQQVGRMTAREARTVLSTAETLRRLPTVTAELADGRLSWSQTVAITKAARRLPAGRLSDLDAFVAGLLDEYADHGPNELIDRTWQQVDAWNPAELEQAEAVATDERCLVLQPNLFGGGRLEADLDTVGFATVAEALDAPLALPTADQVGDSHEAEAVYRAHGRKLADRLVALCEQSLTGDAEGRPARPMAYVVTTADALCDADRTPGWLLTTLTGGKMKASAGLIRRLTDERGTDVRTIVFDNQGEVVGVGQKHYRPPGWLREAVMVRDLDDTGPLSNSAVRRADLDHIIPFPEGGTDVTNLHAPGRRSHTAKTRGDWTVHRQRDGTLIWTHPPTGVKVKRPRRWPP